MSERTRQMVAISAKLAERAQEAVEWHRRVAGGNSYDAEHNAGVSCANVLAELLGELGFEVPDGDEDDGEGAPSTVCILTGAAGEDPDDCHTHRHEGDDPAPSYDMPVPGGYR